MEAGSIIIAIIWIAISAISSAQKKKQREQKKQAAAEAAQAEASVERPVLSPREQTQRGQTRRTQPPRIQRSVPMHDDRFPELDETVAAPRDERFPDLNEKTSKKTFRDLPKAAQPSVTSAEGTALGGSLEGTQAERRTLYAQIDADVGKTALHVVKPVTESEHTHMESSLTGIQADCAPDAPVAPDNSQAYTIPAAVVGTRRFTFDRASVVQGFLYGEILGKPKALRR